jgi:hypothetical protein
MSTIAVPIVTSDTALMILPGSSRIASACRLQRVRLGASWEIGR